MFSHIGLDQRSRFDPPELLPMLASLQRRELGDPLFLRHGLEPGGSLSE